MKMLNSSRQKTNCEDDARFLRVRFQSVERNLADLCDVFAKYARKSARLRDRSNEISNTILNYSKTEQINKSLASCLDNFADCMSTLSDYENVRTQTIESKVVKGFSAYKEACKTAKGEIKYVFAAKDKEVQRKSQLDKIKKKSPRNRQQILQAETDFVRASAELSKTVHNIEEKATTFERQKLHDVKAILLDFIGIELGYHARALEVLTSAFSVVNSIDEDADLQEFKTTLRHPKSNRNRSLSLKTSIFRSVQSLQLTSKCDKCHGVPYKAERMNRSEEMLDSGRQTLSDVDDHLSDSEGSREESVFVRTDESDESSSESNSNMQQSDDEDYKKSAVCFQKSHNKQFKE